MSLMCTYVQNFDLKCSYFGNIGGGGVAYISTNMHMQQLNIFFQDFNRCFGFACTVCSVFEIKRPSLRSQIVLLVETIMNVDSP